MKKRNLVLIVVMSIITLGIYNLYWLIDTRKEMVKKGQSIPSVWTVFVPFLVILLAILLLAASSSFHDSIGQSTAVINIASIIFMPICFIAVLGLGIIFLSAYCRAVERVTKGSLTYDFNFAMAILLTIFGVGFLWSAIVQYHFNRLR